MTLSPEVKQSPRGIRYGEVKIRKRWIILGLTIVLMGILSIPELTHVNTGQSESLGSVRDGKLRNGWLLPFKGPNFRYFSQFSYYILNNAYVHSTVHKTVMEAYAECEKTCPGKSFVLMECTRKHGGRMIFHWTHQNGTSIDFMVPKLNVNNASIWSNHAGLVHYLLQYDEEGKLKINGNTSVDFETMARHILALDDAAARNGLHIRKILFNTQMQDELYATPSGQKIKERGIRIIPHVSDLVNRYHDDHYHVDFEI